jgi:hypothetical protein
MLRRMKNPVFEKKKRGEGERLCFSPKLCNLVPSTNVALDYGIAGVVMEWVASVMVLGGVVAVPEGVGFG